MILILLIALCIIFFFVFGYKIGRSKSQRESKEKIGMYHKDSKRYKYVDFKEAYYKLRERTIGLEGDLQYLESKFENCQYHSAREKLRADNYRIKDRKQRQIIFELKSKHKKK